jgi:predicted amidohydrolase
MKIEAAIVQFRPILCRPEENIARLDSLFEQIDHASLIVLPELASTGYSFSGIDEASECAEELDQSRYIRFLTEKAARKKACIVSGVCEKDGDLLYNTSVLVDAQGIKARYRKIHLFMNEKDIFQPGDGNLPVVDIGGCKVGMLICFDYLFPEVWRLEAMKGADVICHPSNLLTQNAHRCVPGISIMNRVFILTANRTGEERGMQFNGQSFITNPNGEVIARASVEREEILNKELDIDMARNKWITARNHAFSDRRPDIYSTR